MRLPTGLAERPGVRDLEREFERGVTERLGDLERSETDLRAPDGERVRERPREGLRERDGDRDGISESLGIVQMRTRPEGDIRKTRQCGVTRRSFGRGNSYHSRTRAKTELELGPS